ncbi:MAG: hypothetical protein ABR586_00980 [Thermoplasmatota archaeon]
MARAAAIPFVLLLLAGATGGCVEQAAAPSPTPGGLLLGAESRLPTLPRAEATLDAPPAWRLGEWWHVSFSAPPYGISAELDAVVVGTDAGRYVLGMADRLDDGVLLLHFPGFGEVEPATLGFDAHDRAIVPLQFPLVAGKAWQTQWYTGAPLAATVESVDAAAGTATVRMTGARTLTLVYDARLGFISRLAIDGYGGYAVTGHGYGFHGRVLVPAHQDLVFCHGREAVVQAVEFCATKAATDPKAPTETVVLKEGYDRVSFGLFLRDTATAPVGPGVLAIRVTAPDGKVYEASKTPATTGMAMYPHSLEHPAGAWQVTAAAAGEGLAILEGVAYQVLDITLP